MSDELPQNVDLRPFVRIRRSELAAVCLQHRASGIDLSLAATGSSGTHAQTGILAGYTQWRALWRTHDVRVCWNWGRSQSVLFVLNPAGIRANIQLLDDAGNVESFLLSRAYLLEWIEALPWRDTLQELIAQRRSRGP